MNGRKQLKRLVKTKEKAIKQAIEYNKKKKKNEDSMVFNKAMKKIWNTK